MDVLPYAFAVFLVVLGCFVSTSIVLAILGISVFFILVIVALFLYAYISEIISKDRRPPIAGSILHFLVHFDNLFDYQTALARKHSTYLILGPTNSKIYTCDLANIERMLKTNFLNYVKDMLMKSTLDSIFKVGFGVDLNSLNSSDEFGKRFTKAFDDSDEIDFWCSVDLSWGVKRVLNIGLEASLKKNITIINDFVFELIRRKREKMRNGNLDTRKDDILSRFMIECEKDPENMTDRYLRDMILNFVIAGKDTSANTLTWFFYLLCKQPLVQERIAQEVREVIEGQEDIVSPDEFAELIAEEALNKMHYLHAALTETLRLYPLVPLDGKVSAEDDILPDWYKVKKGECMTYMPYAMGRMTPIWGDDADEFRPERWLDGGVFRPESPFKSITFHAGPRICLGKEFAYRQMKILASVLLNFFKFKLVDENKEAKYRTMFTLHMDQGLHLRAIPRL